VSLTRGEVCGCCKPRRQSIRQRLLRPRRRLWSKPQLSRTSRLKDSPIIETKIKRDAFLDLRYPLIHTMVVAFSGIVLRRRRMERQDRLPSRLTQYPGLGTLLFRDLVRNCRPTFLAFREDKNRRHIRNRDLPARTISRSRRVALAPSPS
jgi:hypothetical protein